MNKHVIKALIIEDDPGDAKLLQTYLNSIPEAGYELENAWTLAGGLACLKKNKYEVILLDLSLPDSRGLETFHAVNKRCSDIPIIVLTGFDDAELAVESVNSGAQDYLVKGQVDSKQLYRSIRYSMERKKAQNDLSDEKKKLSEIIKGTNAGTWEWNVQTGETSFNERWANIIGYTLEELSPVSIDTWMKFTHPDDLQESDKLLNMHFAGELDYYKCEARMRHRNGHWVWILDRGRVSAWTDDGKPLLMFGTHVDITDRKIADKERVAALKMSEDVIEGMVDGVIITDIDGKIVRVNTAASKQNGYSKDDMTGKTPQELFLNDIDAPIFQEAIDRISSGESEAVYDIESQRKDGTTFPSSVILSAVRDSNETPISIIAVVRDITERMKLELMKDDFLSSVSHELKTPLASIKGFTATILADPEMPEETRTEFMGIISDASDRLDTLIMDLLDISRIETGGIKVEKEPVRLVDVLDEVYSQMTIQAQKKELVFEKKTESKDGTIVFADKKHIGQILINLLGNAIKFTPEKGSISTIIIQDGNMAGFRVSDTGYGITKNEIEHIFDKFYRVHRPGLEIQGTGLGLAIVKQLVETNGGTISVFSEEGNGTTFEVVFPVTDSSYK